MPEFVSEPEKFYPERWMKQSASSASNNFIHPFASLPYGHGPRMCLGRRFADLEMQILVAKVTEISACYFGYFVLSHLKYSNLLVLISSLSIRLGTSFEVIFKAIIQKH